MKRNKEWEQSQPDIKTKTPDSFSSPTEAQKKDNIMEGNARKVEMGKELPAYVKAILVP
jgi:hypothetical protein